MTKTHRILLKISYTAIFSALIFIVTHFIAIPYPGGAGYFNIGDGIILFTSIYFGPMVGGFSAMIGSGFADLASGYANFIPFTIVAKLLESLVAFGIFYLLRKHSKLIYISNFVAPLFMVLTYFISYIVLYGYAYAAISSPFDIIQGVVGSVLSIVLIEIFNKIKVPGNTYFMYIERKANKEKKATSN